MNQGKLNDTQCLLWAAQMLISDPKDWCQGSYARTRTGGLPNSDEEAVKFCAIGACLEVEKFSSLDEDPLEYLRAAAWLRYRKSTIWVNDRLTHADVMAVFDKAIELAGDNA